MACVRLKKRSNCMCSHCSGKFNFYQAYEKRCIPRFRSCAYICEHVIYLTLNLWRHTSPRPARPHTTTSAAFLRAVSCHFIFRLFAYRYLRRLKNVWLRKHIYMHVRRLCECVCMCLCVSEAESTSANMAKGCNADNSCTTVCCAGTTSEAASCILSVPLPSQRFVFNAVDVAIVGST